MDWGDRNATVGSPVAALAAQYAPYELPKRYPGVRWRRAAVRFVLRHLPPRGARVFRPRAVSSIHRSRSTGQPCRPIFTDCFGPRSFRSRLFGWERIASQPGWSRCTEPSRCSRRWLVSSSPRCLLPFMGKAQQWQRPSAGCARQGIYRQLLGSDCPGIHAAADRICLPCDHRHYLADSSPADRKSTESRGMFCARYGPASGREKVDLHVVEMDLEQANCEARLTTRRYEVVDPERRLAGKTGSAMGCSIAARCRTWRTSSKPWTVKGQQKDKDGIVVAPSRHPPSERLVGINPRFSLLALERFRSPRRATCSPNSY